MSEKSITEILNEYNEKFRLIREGKYIVTPMTYKEEYGVVTVGGGELVDKETGELVE